MRLDYLIVAIGLVSLLTIFHLSRQRFDAQSTGSMKKLFSDFDGDLRIDASEYGTDPVSGLPARMFFVENPYMTCDKAIEYLKKFGFEVETCGENLIHTNAIQQGWWSECRYLVFKRQAA